MNETATAGQTTKPKKPRSMGEIRIYMGDGTATLEAVYCADRQSDMKPMFGTMDELSASTDRRVDGSEKIMSFEDAGKAEAWIRDHGADGKTYSIIAFKAAKTVEVEVVETRRIK